MVGLWSLLSGWLWLIVSLYLRTLEGLPVFGLNSWTDKQIEGGAWPVHGVWPSRVLVSSRAFLGVEHQANG